MLERWFPLTKRSRIYLDYAGATPVSSAALTAMNASYALWGNPGAIHTFGVEALRSLEDSRSRIARELACKPRELIFTSGGTESNNMAILGAARSLLLRGIDLSTTHWAVSAIEHPSVLDCFAEIERMGALVTHIDPNKRGVIEADALARALRPSTCFVSIGWANGEIGSLALLSEIGQIIEQHERTHNTIILFHSDAGQAPLYFAPQVHTLRLDLLSLDSGKLYGPRGVGALYVGKRAQLSKIMLGGSQERGLRAGTENVVLAAGFAAAFEECCRARTHELKRVRSIQARAISEINALIPNAVINGDSVRGMPNMLNISIPGIASEYVVLALDRAGFSVSTKSACREGQERRSHVVEALGLEKWRSETTIRISFGTATTEKNIVRFSRALAALVKR